MRCYNCGFEAEADICPGCKSPLRTYRIITDYSSAYYNDGLERAINRDLSGAVRSLSMCLKLDKNNIDARNLLGLIYYETGDTVHAITEWVISKNLQQDDNGVDKYLGELRNNPDLLENMNSAIKKYNFALRNVRKKHYDAARIQLKKVLQLNPKLLKARQLLALLYMEREDYARARFELDQCARIDIASEQTNLFQREIDRIIAAKTLKLNENKNAGKKASAFAYRSGNDTIIQPAKGFFTSGGAISVLSVLFGIVLGIAAVYLLVIPDRLKEAQLSGNERIAAISEELDVKNSDLGESAQKIESLNLEIENLKETIKTYEGAGEGGGVTENLANAAPLYLSGEYDIASLAAFMDKITSEDLAKMKLAGYKKLYDSVVAVAGVDLSDYFFDQAFKAMSEEKTEEAIRLYTLSVQYNEKNSHALYNLAEAVNLSGDTEKALKIYDQVVQKFAGTKDADNAKAKIIELNR